MSYEYRLELLGMGDSCSHPLKYTPDHSHDDSCLLYTQVAKLKQELEGMWEHIRKLEQEL